MISADQGLPESQFRLGKIALNGSGVDQNYQMATYWFSKAGKQGDTYSQMRLGSLYEKGDGLNKDYNKAIYWYKQAAMDGHFLSFLKLVDLRKMLGIRNGCEEASLFLKLALKGNINAQKYLGDLYRDGVGVIQNESEAELWYRKAGMKKEDIDTRLVSKIEENCSDRFREGIIDDADIRDILIEEGALSKGDSVELLPSNQLYRGNVMDEEWSYYFSDDEYIDD